MSANVMTLEEKLYAMRMVDLAAFAEKHGVKINKKGSKAIAIDKILTEMDDEPEAIAPEAIRPKEIKNTKDFLKAIDDVLDGKPIEKSEEKPEEKPKTVKKELTTAETNKPKAEIKKAAETENKKAGARTNLKIKDLTYKGKTQSIKDWAKEIDMPWPTLYDRVNRNGWTVEEALTIPLGGRRKKITKE